MFVTKKTETVLPSFFFAVLIKNDGHNLFYVKQWYTGSDSIMVPMPEQFDLCGVLPRYN
jgi:hypothetical protein